MTPGHRAWSLTGTGRRPGSRVAHPLSAALAASAVALLSGGVVGHAVALSTTTLASDFSPSTHGEPVTLTATITPVAPAPTGSVTFQDGGANIAGCVNRAVSARVATCSVSSLTAATHTLTAVYHGNSTYAGSTSIAVMQLVDAGSTTTALGASANPSVTGQTVTYTATVSAIAPASGRRTGTVDFEDGGVTLTGCGAKTVAAAGTATCAVAYPAPGSHSVTAVYSGDGNFTGSTSAILVQAVNPGATATALASSVNPSRTGARVTFIAAVRASAPASGTRTGTVDFQAAGVTITGCGAQAVAASGKATCATNALAVGTTAITAVYSGGVDFTGSTSSTLTQVVNQGATTTTVASSLNPSSTGVNVTFTATVRATSPATGTRTGTVDFQDGGVDITGCGAQTVAAAGTATCTTAALAAGSHSITATYGGDADFVTSTSAPLAQTVVSTTSTVVTSSTNPSVNGQNVQYTATVTGGPAATGTITFRDGGASIAGCVALPVSAGIASCTASPAFGSHAITAVYSGDPANAASTSPALTQVVGAGGTTTVIASTVNPSVFGQPVAFTATVSANAPGTGTPTGRVVFQDGGANIAGCGNVAIVSGAATCTTTALSVGPHHVVGTYKGSASFLTSASITFTQTVDQGATASAVVSTVDPSVAGQPVSYTATVSVVAPAEGSLSGTVAFLDGGVTIGGCGATSLVLGAASCTVTYAAAAAHAVSAVYSGNAGFAGSESPSITQSVDPASTSTALTSTVNPSVAGQVVTITASVTVTAPGAGTPSGTVEFQDGGIDIAGCAAQAVSGSDTSTCITSLPTAGTHSITATYSGDASFAGSASSSLDQTVNQASTAAAIGASVNPSMVGQAVTITATVTVSAPGAGSPTGTISFQDGGALIAGCGSLPLAGSGSATCVTAFPAAGEHPVTAVYGGDADFDGSSSTAVTQTVAQGSTTTAIAASSNGLVVAGYSVTLSAAIAPASPASGVPTGAVEFLDGITPISGCIAQPLVAGVARCSVVYGGPGVHAMSAAYSGDHDFAGSASSTLTMTVSLDPSVPDTGAHATPSVWCGLAVLGGFLLLCLGMLVRRRGRSAA